MLDDLLSLKERVLARQCCRWGVQSGQIRQKTHLQSARSFSCANNNTLQGSPGHVRSQGCVIGQVSLINQGHIKWPMNKIACSTFTKKGFSTTCMSMNRNNASENKTNEIVAESVSDNLGENVSNNLHARNLSNGNSEFKSFSDERLFNESPSEEETSLEVKDSKQELTLKRIQDLSKGDNLDDLHEGEITPLDDLPPKRIVKPVYNFAAIVNKSETLTNFVKMGVDLSAIEKDRGATDLLVRLDFEEDVKPVVLFLHDIGVASDNLGNIITKYPSIFQLSLENMRKQIDYFRSKNFVAESITRIVTKLPGIFESSVIDIDTQLGGYQTEFKLTGDELRDVVTRLPKILTWQVGRVKEVKFYMKEFLGFSLSEIRSIFISHPKVLLSGKHQLGKRFDFLYNEMKVTHNALVAFPRVFRTRVPIIQQRHMFLKHVGRDQYDPKKENYVSLQALVTYKDRDFAFHLAKTSVAQYNDFLKTI